MRGPILDAYEAAIQAVLNSGPGSGTTLVAVEVVGSTIRTYNVGDSGAFLVGQRGRLKIETTDHSPVGYGVAAGLIDSETAMTHEDRHFLSNYVGSKEMHIEKGTPKPSAHVASVPAVVNSEGSCGIAQNVKPKLSDHGGSKASLRAPDAVGQRERRVPHFGPQ